MRTSPPVIPPLAPRSTSEPASFVDRWEETIYIAAQFTDRYFLPLTEIISLSAVVGVSLAFPGYRAVVDERTLQRSDGGTSRCLVACASSVSDSGEVEGVLNLIFEVLASNVVVAELIFVLWARVAAAASSDAGEISFNCSPWVLRHVHHGRCRYRACLLGCSHAH